MLKERTEVMAGREGGREGGRVGGRKGGRAGRGRMSC